MIEVYFNYKGWGIAHKPADQSGANNWYWYHIPCRQIVKANNPSICCEKCNEGLEKKSIHVLRTLLHQGFTAEELYGRQR